MIITITGGSGSGKSKLAEQIQQQLGHDHVALLSLDSYYRNQSDVPTDIQGNFDHPEALDTELLCQHLDQLRSGQTIDMPQYDFTTHSRLPATQRFSPKPIMLLDGILTLALPGVNTLTDQSIFVDTPADLRLARRLLRDVRERGRTPDSVIRQYLDTVRPMHDQYVEPYKHQVDILIDNETDFLPETDAVIKLLGLKAQLT